MMSELLESVPESVLQSFAKIFDKLEKPNWRTIVSVLPERFYRAESIELFGMAVLKPGGSPTMSLLKDLVKRKVKLSDLFGWLHCLAKKGFNTEQAVLLLEQKELSSPTSQSSSAGRIIITSNPSSVNSLIRNTTGNTYTIQCSAHGDEPLHYQWFHGKMPVGTDSCVLLIGPPYKQSNGWYICRVSNGSSYCFTDWAFVEVSRSEVQNGAWIPLITVHPRTVTCFVGEDVGLFCDAAGNPAPTFQWYHEDKKILKANSRDFSIMSAKASHAGLYTCTASNEYGTVTSLSANVSVIERSKQPPENSDYFRGRESLLDQCDSGPLHASRPVSKVALLIGNQNYEHSNKLGMLIHPGNDARDVGGALRSVGFTVVSLLDLKLKDIRKAVELFCDLLAENVYAVFYFAGHGFEVEGQSYLMPVDASGSFCTTENYPASEVLSNMVKRKTKLNMVILDCCRTTPRSYLENPIPRLCKELSVTQSNVVICFGCCSQGRVLESPNCSNGFLAEYLCEHIGKNIKVDDVLFEVAKSIHKKNIVDPANERAQVTYRHSTLVEELSLCDPTVTINAFDDQQQSKRDTWELLHEAPLSPVTVFRNDTVQVDFIFTAEFSNVLLIQSKILSSACCVVRFLMPSSIGGSKVEILKNEKGEKGEHLAHSEVVRISNLERLRGEVTIHLEVTYDIGSERKREMTFYSIGERPLYARIADLNLTI